MTLCGAVGAALPTSGTTVIVFKERMREGVWTYFVFIPLLYFIFSFYRSRLGRPSALEDHLDRILTGQYLLPYQREARPKDEINYKNIVVPLDGSMFAEYALGLARVLTRIDESRLTLISVDQMVTRESRARVAGHQSKLEAYLGNLSQRIKSTGFEVNFTASNGPVAEMIDTLAHNLGADLIVMSTQVRAGVERLFASNVASDLVKITSIPLLLIHPSEEWKSRTWQFRKLLVSIDGSKEAEQVLCYVRAVAKRFESEILLLSVPEAESDKPQLQQYLDSVVAALGNRGLDVKPLVTGSGPARTILDLSESEPIDLIMMSSHGRGGIHRGILIGSVADRVIQSTHCPVFLVPVRNRRRFPPPISAGIRK
jgi:nucleotide-binding universal stress UspA family protein